MISQNDSAALVNIQTAIFHAQYVTTGQVCNCIINYTSHING